MGLGTPLSLPTSEGSISAGHGTNAPVTGHGFHGHHSMAQVFQNPNPFGFQQQQHHHHHHQTFPPHHFTQQPTHYENFQPTEPPKMEESMSLDVEMQEHSPTAAFGAQSFDATMRHVPMPAPVDKYVAIQHSNLPNTCDDC
jgi:hypothetical protein